MNLLSFNFFEFFGVGSIVFIFYIIFILFLIFIRKRIPKIENRFFDSTEYLPVEEIKNIKQLSYLVFALLFIIDASYLFIISASDLLILEIFDIIISLAACVFIYKKSIDRILAIILLIPVSSTLFIVTGNGLIYALELIHLIGIVYVAVLLAKKFIEYTNHNNLGLTMLLFFIILSVSLFVTSIAENVNIIDSMVMITNAFTSNGYSILGHTELGKIDSLFLTWGGYLLSGVGTATLTVAIMNKRFNKRFDELEDLIKNQNKKD